MTIRRLITLSTILTLTMLLTLIAVVQHGFRQASDSSHRENTHALPALIAMLEMRFDIVQIQQYLSDVSATGEADGFDDAKKFYAQTLQRLDELTTHAPELAAQAAAIKADLEKFHTFGVEMAQAYRLQGRDAGNALMKRPNDGFDAQAEKLTAKIETLDRAVRKTMTESAQTSEDKIATASGISIALGLAACAFAIVFGALVFKQLLRILGSEPGYAVRIARRIADGDLAQNVQIADNDHDSLLGTIRDMQEGLRTLIRGIASTTDSLNISANELSTAATEVARTVSFQSDKSTSIAASIEEMSVSTSHIADSAHSAHKNAIGAHQLTSKGAEMIDEAMIEVDKLTRSVADTAMSVQSLGDRSEEIARIVDVIREIADQTNLLALNAAIEAARAGEQGRGFAVVADEVRKLAERTATATLEIKTTVDSVRTGTSTAVAEMNQGSERVQASVSLIRRVRDAMQEITAGVDLVLLSADEIAAQLKEQDVATQDIARSVEGIAQMTEETNAVAKSVAQSADHLDGLARSMSRLVQKFQV